MAARKRTWTPDAVRQKIRTSMLINRLQNHVAGRLDMSKTQIQAAGILLRKTLPDMVAHQNEGRELENMAHDELVSALNALTGYLAAQGVEPGAAEAGRGNAPAAVPTVQ